MKKIKKEGLKVIAWVTLLYSILNIFYLEINPIVNYMWKLQLNFSWLFTFINYILLILLFRNSLEYQIWIRHFFQILIVGIFMPTAIISNHISNGIEMCFIIFFSINLSIILFKLFTNFQSSQVLLKKTGKVIIHIKIFYKSVLILSLMLLSYFLVIGNTALIHFDLSRTFLEIYDIRNQYRLQGLGAYFPGFFVSVLVPSLVSDYFENKNKISLYVCILSILVLFQLFAMKVHLFLLLLYFLFGILYINYKKYSEFSVLLFFTIVILITILLGPTIYPVLDRFFYLPGQLQIHYYDYFSKNAFNYFQGSKLGIFFDQPGYSLPVGYVISFHYYNAGVNIINGMNANTGYFASIYAEIGLFGILLASLIISIYLYFLNQLCIKQEILGYLITIGIGFWLINASAIDIFLTNGVIIVVMISFIIENSNKINNYKINNKIE